MSYRDYEKSVSYNNQYENLYVSPLKIPQVLFLGSLGQKCNSTMDCHQRLDCVEGVCDYWKPQLSESTSSSTPLTNKEGFVTKQYDYRMFPTANEPPTPRNSSISDNRLCYTRKYKANSGKNWY
jgi:hypothetical protein